MQLVSYKNLSVLLLTPSLEFLLSRVFSMDYNGWDDFRNLCVPTKLFSFLNHPSDSMAQSYEDINLEDFIELMQDVYYLGGFEEIETGKVINAYDSIAKVFQSFTTLDSEGNVGADITSYQMEFLTTDGGLQMCFGLPIPMRF